MLKFILRIFYLLFLLLLPFILLIRVAVGMHEQYAWNGWLALLVSGSVTSLIVLIYFSFLYSKITGKVGDWMAFKRRAYAAGFLVFAFAAYGLFYISGENMKHREIRSEYRELHPILRMSVSTLILVDRDLLITDGSRQPEDYKRMGLKTNNHSLHYKQSDGFSHALDIRTKGRPEWLNKTVQIYFRLMGFNTLRHVGTADHLHVSLMSHDRRGSI